MARVVLIRHGETDWSRDARWQGHSDVPLNARGHAQAAALAPVLARLRPQRIVTSDLVRTQETARPLAELLDLPLTTDADLREVDVGSWSGLTHDEAAARCPEGVARHDAGGVGWTDGETYGQVAERAERALIRHTDGLDDGALVVVVAHGGLIGAVTGRILGIDPEEQRRRIGRMGHGHATYLRRVGDATGARWRLLAYNSPLLADAGPPAELRANA